MLITMREEVTEIPVQNGILNTQSSVLLSIHIPSQHAGENHILQNQNNCIEDLSQRHKSTCEHTTLTNVAV